jgi:hypothetical protein
MDVSAYRTTDECADWYSKCARITSRLPVACLLTAEKTQQAADPGAGNRSNNPVTMLKLLKSNLADLIALIFKSSCHLSDLFVAGKL